MSLLLLWPFKRHVTGIKTKAPISALSHHHLLVKPFVYLHKNNELTIIYNKIKTQLPYWKKASYRQFNLDDGKHLQFEQ